MVDQLAEASGPAQTAAGPTAAASERADGHQLLECRDISVHFEGVTALEDVSLSILPGVCLGLIGPNGAGKTTLINVLTGFQKPDTGLITIDKTDITRWRPDSIARAGVVRTFQGVRLFPGLTVGENVEASAAGMGLRRNAARARAMEVLEWMGIADLANLKAGALPYGGERQIGLARALAPRPKFLLLDEPAAGLNEAECDQLMATVARIPEDFQCGVLLIEHNMRVIMGVCETLHVLDGGRTIAEGPTEEVRSDARVIEAYLGSKRRRRRRAPAGQ